MSVWLGLALVAIWLGFVEMFDTHLKLRKFQRNLGMGTIVKYTRGRKWRFAVVKSVHGELIHVEVEGGLEWVKRSLVWPIQEWDRHDGISGKS